MYEEAFHRVEFPGSRTKTRANKKENKMYAEHKTRDGKKMYISQMDNRHLENTIRIILKHIEDAKKVSSQEVPLSKFQQTVYKMNTARVEKKAAQMISALTEKLYPYLAEAMLRGQNYTADLQRVFERKASDSIVTLSFDGHAFPELEYFEMPDEEDNF
jgi:hypothetical protein